MMKKYFFASILFVYSYHIIAQTPTVGLISHLSGCEDDGYVLFAPVTNCDTTFLINKCGRLIHKWPSKYAPGDDAYLLPDGTLLRSGHYPNALFDMCGCGTGGIIERIDWNGNVVWHYVISDTLQVQSHDICYMPNGHILVDVWENIGIAEMVANGRKPTYTTTRIYSAKVMELKPLGADSAVVVWQWRLWDHLIQDYNPTKFNYGVVADHPELVNLNYINLATEPPMASDWIHLNAVTYNADLDQVMISSHNTSEIWIIDHSTTTAQAATHSGGKHGKGGDLLYRWGNPTAYNMGTSVNEKLFEQHNPTWITQGKYKGQIMIFNNGRGRPGGDYSSIDIIQPPVDTAGDYAFAPGMPFGPLAPTWSYVSSPHVYDFYSIFMGGAQLLPRGNLLITNAGIGKFFEVDTSGNTVWEYVNPVDNGITLKQGKNPTQNYVYRCVFYPASYSGFAGRTLEETTPIELNPLPYTCILSTDTGTGTPIITNAKNGITIFPNPVTSSFVVQQAANCVYTVSDITGRILQQGFIQSNKQEVDIGNLNKGMYLLRLVQADGNAELFKLLKQ